MFTSLFRILFKTIGKCYKSINVRRSSGKPQNLRTYRCTGNIRWNVTVQMLHTSNSKKVMHLSYHRTVS